MIINVSQIRLILKKKLLEDKNKKQPIINKSNKSYKIYEDYIDYNNDYDEEY